MSSNSNTFAFLRTSWSIRPCVLTFIQNPAQYVSNLGLRAPVGKSRHSHSSQIQPLLQILFALPVAHSVDLVAEGADVGLSRPEDRGSCLDLLDEGR